MPTIRDVAQRAQVSPATVSQMLSGRAKPQPKTRKRIEQAIADLGYRRGTVGRPRKATAARQIAVVMPGQPIQHDMRHPLSRRRVNAIRSAIINSGEHFGLYVGAGDHIDGDWVFRDAVRHGDVDGVILSSPYPGDGYLTWLLQRDLPLVVLERFPEHHEFSYVAVDNFKGGRLAGEHFASLGHQRMAYLHATRVITWTRLRRAGLEAAAKAHDLEPPAVTAVDPDGPDSAFDDAIAAMMDAGVTAVFAASDGLAVKCIDTLQSLGRRVPDDVSVIGFDDMGYTSASGLRPSTIAYDTADYAQQAVGLMRHLLDNRDRVSHLATCVQTRLVDYQTTAPLQKGSPS